MSETFPGGPLRRLAVRRGMIQSPQPTTPATELDRMVDRAGSVDAPVEVFAGGILVTLSVAPTGRLEDSTTTGWSRRLAAVVLLGLLVRSALLAQSLRTGGLDDLDKYLPLARGLVEGRGFALDGRPTAYRPPLYPLVLAPIVAVMGPRVDLGVAALHLVLGAATMALTWVAARRWGLAPGLSLFAVAVVAFDPVLVSQSRTVMTETLAAFLTAAALSALTLPGMAGVIVAGLAFGLGTLCRPSALPVAGMTALAALVFGPGNGRARVRRAVVLVVSAAALLTPWAARNWAVFGAPVWTTTHGGYTLYLANNPVYYNEVVNGPSGAVWTGPNQNAWWDQMSRAARGLSEPRADRAQRAAALRVIRTRPLDFARASVARLGRFWGLAPAAAVYPRGLRVLTTLWTIPIWVALACGLASRTSWRWPRVAAPAALFALTIVHTIYWTDLRMRAPLAPAIALLAATGLGRFSETSFAPKEGVRKDLKKK